MTDEEVIRLAWACHPPWDWRNGPLYCSAPEDGSPPETNPDPAAHRCVEFRYEQFPEGGTWTERITGQIDETEVVVYEACL